MMISIQKKPSQLSDDKGNSIHEFIVSNLKPIYERYGVFVYSLCLRLLADKNAAESATIDVFVQFSKELMNSFDEMQILSRLKELARYTSLSKLGKGSDKFAAF